MNKMFILFDVNQLLIKINRGFFIERKIQYDLIIENLKQTTIIMREKFVKL